MTEADVIAYGLHSKFNAWLENLASRDIRQFGLNGNRFGEDRLAPKEFVDYKRKNRNAGFSFVLIIKDRRGTDAYVVATHDGHFWPLTPSRADGMGAQTRNAWAAKELERRFSGFNAPPPETEAEILARMDDAIRALTG